MKKILLFNGQSAYFSQNVSTEHLSKALTKLGYENQIIDLGEKNFVDQIIGNLSQTEFIYSFNGRGHNLGYSDNQSLYDQHNIPFVFGLGDHPIYHFERIIQSSQNCLLLCHELSHYNAIRANKQLSTAANMVALTEEQVYFSPSEEVNDDYEKFCSRPIDIFLPCSYQDTNAIFEWLDKLPQQLRRICFLIIEIGINDDYHSIDEMANIIFEKEKIILSNRFDLNMSLILAQVDSFIRGYRRERCVSTLLEKGFTVHVCGNGWEYFPKKEGEKLVLHNVSHNSETLALIRQSKVVLNLGPLWPYSSHERVLTSMNLGAAVLSERNHYHDEKFTHKENILLFSSKEVHCVAELLHDYLNDVNKLFEIAKSGQQHVQKTFSWEKYAKKLVELVEMHKIIHNIKK